MQGLTYGSVCSGISLATMPPSEALHPRYIHVIRRAAGVLLARLPASRRRRLMETAMGKSAMNMAGMIFGRLTVMHRAASNGHGGKPRWVCVCQCGTEIDIPGARLRSGSNKSCGCFRRDRAGGLYRKHGKSKTIPYIMFYDARKRSIKLGIPFSIEPEDIVIPDRCPVLGMRMDGVTRETTPSLDRVIPARGYVKSNIRVISFRANRLKSDATDMELEAVLNYVRSSQ